MHGRRECRQREEETLRESEIEGMSRRVARVSWDEKKWRKTVSRVLALYTSKNHSALIFFLSNASCQYAAS